MPPTKTKLRREFDTALAAYLEAIQNKKTALFAVTNQPSKEANKKYEKTALEEKEARRTYRKATRKLHALVR
jgi:menaquinone-dependent protoporphyrinogen IX oxidase